MQSDALAIGDLLLMLFKNNGLNQRTMGKPKHIKQRTPNAYDRFCERLSAFYAAHRRAVDMTVVGVIFVAFFCIRAVNIDLRKQLHSDEIFSVSISTCNDYYNSPLPDGDYSGEQLKHLLVADDRGGVEGAAADIAQLWVNNGDAPHASLYYMFLRPFLIGFDTFDVHSLAWRGGALNLLFFSLSFFMMLRLLRRIYPKRSLLVFVGLVMAFGNWMSIRNTLLIREYQMAETAIIAVMLIGVDLIIRLREGEAVAVRRLVVGLALTIAAAISLGYFNAIFIVGFGVVVMCACAKYRRRDLIKWLLVSAVGSVVVALILYPGFFNFLLHDSVHKQRAFSSVRNIVGNVMVRDLLLKFFTVPGALIVAGAFVAALIGNRRRELFKSGNFAWISVLAVACMFVIQYASLLKMPRYYFPLTPALALLVPHVIGCVGKQATGFFELLIILYFPALTMLYSARSNYNWQSLRNGLAQSTTFSQLNPNEVVQLLPGITDTATYTIAGDGSFTLKRNEETFVVSKRAIGICNDSIMTYKRLMWGRHIFLYKFNYVPKVESDENL